VRGDIEGGFCNWAFGQHIRPVRYLLYRGDLRETGEVSRAPTDPLTKSLGHLGFIRRLVTSVLPVGYR